MASALVETPHHTCRFHSFRALPPPTHLPHPSPRPHRWSGVDRLAGRFAAGHLGEKGGPGRIGGNGELIGNPQVTGPGRRLLPFFSCKGFLEHRNWARHPPLELFLFRSNHWSPRVGALTKQRGRTPLAGRRHRHHRHPRLPGREEPLRPIHDPSGTASPDCLQNG